MSRKAGGCAVERRTEGEQAWRCSPALVVSSPDTGPHRSVPGLSATPGRLGLQPLSALEVPESFLPSSPGRAMSRLWLGFVLKAGFLRCTPPPAAAG